MLFTFVSTFMLVYLYEGVGFSTADIATLTIILTFTKIWDAVNDLIMGVVVDHTRTRWGKLRPYILFTATPIALLTILMFAVPDMKEQFQLVYIAVLYILWDMTYTMCDVPYWGLTGALNNDTFGLIIVQVGGAVVAVIVFGDEGIFTILGAAIIIGIAISTIATPLALKKISKKTLVMIRNELAIG